LFLALLLLLVPQLLLLFLVLISLLLLPHLLVLACLLLLASLFDVFVFAVAGDSTVDSFSAVTLALLSLLICHHFSTNFP
jgi:hypothetical protein